MASGEKAGYDVGMVGMRQEEVHGLLAMQCVAVNAAAGGAGGVGAA
jgi:hypothetical protein